MRLALALLLCASAAAAQAPETSLRPEPRPEAETARPVDAQAGVLSALVDRPAAAVRPRARPQEPALRPERDIASPASSLRPRKRGPALDRYVRQVLARRARGQVCGDPALQGDRIAPIVGRVSGCGVAEPVRLRAVSGLRLSTPARMDCRTARALKTWVEEGVKPATGTLGGGPSSLRVAAGYACRTRNNQPGARISEHGKGRAIDISGIGLRSGQEITVLTDWGRGEAGRVLREVWRAACGPFGTVLGPEANRFHRDHFHFDTARYRSGSFCR